MCFITNGDLNNNLRIMYNKIKDIETRQIIILDKLKDVLSKLDKGERCE